MVLTRSRKNSEGVKLIIRHEKDGLCIWSLGQTSSADSHVLRCGRYFKLATFNQGFSRDLTPPIRTQQTCVPHWDKTSGCWPPLSTSRAVGSIPLGWFWCVPGSVCTGPPEHLQGPAGEQRPPVKPVFTHRSNLAYSSSFHAAHEKQDKD